MGFPKSDPNGTGKNKGKESRTQRRKGKNK